MTVSAMTLSPTTGNRPDLVGLGAVPEPVTAQHHSDLIARASRRDYRGWLSHVMPAAACSHPIRLKLDATWHGSTGSQTEHVTDGLPDGLVYVACKNRRANVCPACAETYRADTYQLVKAGLVGGKGVPESVTEHPCFFVTLTAPSFGPVHSRVIGSNGKPRPCRHRRVLEVCRHNRLLSCLSRHQADDPVLGEAVCRDCYDYDAQAVWNFHAAELWRRTTIDLARRLKKAASARGVRVRLSFAKVAEYQRRGVVHFHALVRIDGVDPDDRDRIIPPDGCMTPELVSSLIDTAARITRFTTASHPHNHRGWVIRWGTQTDIRRVRLAATDVDDQGALTTQAVAAYLSKYATKATESAGHTSRRLTAQTVLFYGEQDTHQARQLVACWYLGALPPLRSTRKQRDEWDAGWGRLQKWAHMLGFGGHFSTKSRRYSTTLSALRAVRKAFQRGEDPVQVDQLDGDPLDGDQDGETAIVTLTWLYDGTGWLTTADAQLANTAAAKAREKRRTAREEVEDSLN